MPEIYNPPATPVYSGAYQLPVDGDRRNAASVKVGAKKLADDIKAVRNAELATAAALAAESAARSRSQALDFRVLIHIVVSFFRGLYVAGFRAWGFVGNEDFYAGTRDPLDYPTATEIDVSVFLGSPFITYDFDVAPDGSLMIFSVKSDSTFADAAQTRDALGTWALFGGVGVSQYFPNVRYDVAHARWVAAFKDENNTASSAWSNDLGVTWHITTGSESISTLPLGGIPDNAIVTLAYHGGVLVVSATLGTNAYFSRSTDGGVTWSAAVVKALGFVAASFGLIGVFPVFQRPVWTGTKWVAMIGDASATTKVYSSPDGAAWALVATLGFLGADAIALSWFEAVGGLVVASMFFGTSIVMIQSSDDGVTWNSSDQEFIASRAPQWLVSGPSANRLVAMSGAGHFYPSGPVTPPDSPVT